MTAVLTTLGGLGFFLLGIHHMTEGLKSMAGDELRRVLQKFVSGRFSAIVSGVGFTAATQSSTATSLTVIGFVSAGLLTVSQAIGVIAGATLGTTTTPWMVAFFGFRMRIADAALPILGIGAFLWVVGSGKARSFGAILAGISSRPANRRRFRAHAPPSWHYSSFTTARCAAFATTRRTFATPMAPISSRQCPPCGMTRA
jgi:Na+/phosphate symporter